MGTTTTHLWNFAALPTLAAVEVWLARRPSSPDLTWCAFADPDGAVGLVPSGPGGEACPALLLTERVEGYDVTVCDPDGPTELGVFSTIEEALQRIDRWMTKG
jgi:hypothetical protein